MTILVHPTLCRDPIAIQEFEVLTGMKVMTRAHKAPQLRVVKSKKTTDVLGPDFKNILLECTACGHTSNMHLRGESCSRCKQGVMFDAFNPFDGGSAA